MASSMACTMLKSPIISNTKWTVLFNAVRNYYKPYYKKLKKTVPKERTGTIKHRHLISSAQDSLAARGFLRSYLPYTPPENATAVVIEICQKVLGLDYSSKSFSREEKFEILNNCFKEFNYSIPNSLLHKISNIDDIIKFYQTPVTTTTPYDDLIRRDDLPPNLYIQKDYIRFHPDTDTVFGGISAFPEESTIVTGLKAKQKYKGFKADPPKSYFNDAHYTKTNLFE